MTSPPTRTSLNKQEIGAEGAAAVRTMARLHRIELADCRIGGEALAPIAASPSAEHLAEVKLSFNPLGHAATELARALRRVEGLRLAGADLDDAAVAQLLAEAGEALRELDLDYNAVTDASVDAIASRSGQLSSVSLIGTKMTRDGKKAIDTALALPKKASRRGA